MKKRLIVLTVPLLVGCATTPKQECTFLYTDFRDSHGKLHSEPVYDCSRRPDSVARVAGTEKR